MKWLDKWRGREGTAGRPLKEILRLELEVRPYLHGVPYWTAAVLVGFVAVLYSTSFSAAIDVANGVVEHYPYLILVLAPLCFMASVGLVDRFAPAAGGTGIPRVITALGMDSATQAREIDQLMSWRVALVVILSSLLCVLGGGALGREGPMVHIAACIFYVVGRQFQKVWPNEDHRSWIVAGGAAGIAAAFNAPLAGVVFVLEELAQQHFHKFKTTVITAAIIGGIISQWLTGRYLFFGYPKVGLVPISSVFWALVLGVLCGLVAVLFHRLLSYRIHDRIHARFRSRIGFAFLCGLVVGLVALVNHGAIGGGISTIQELLFHDEKRATWGLIFARFAATIVSHLAGCAGGFLAPSLALGASLGSKFADLTSYPNHNLLVMVGMSAFLSAVVRAPFTAWVIVMEMTDRHSAIFPLMVASLVSYGTVTFIEEQRAAAAKPAN